MKKIWRRLLVLCGIFILAASAFVLRQHFSEEPDEAPSYEAWGGATLPVISTKIHEQKVNVLHGYTGAVDVTAMEDTLMPIGEDGLLPLTVDCYENTLESIAWKLRTRDNSRTVQEGSVEQWTQNHEKAEFTLQLGQFLTTDGDFRLEIDLALASGQSVSYHTRVRKGEELHEEEMVDFVMDFHRATFDKKAAESYAVNLENDGTADDGTLADVTIHSSFDQLTWGDLAPDEVGELCCSIQELDGTFGTLYLEYEIEAMDEAGDRNTFLATEAFTIQWSSTRFYLMNYRRTLEELFTPDDSRFKDGKLNFGVIDPEEIQTIFSENGTQVAFTAAGELWSFRESGDLVQVFSFRDDDDGVRSGYRRNGIKILRVEEGGDVSFLLYGYMNRGQHEGQVGVSYLKYVEEDNALSEIFFLPYAGTYETLAAGIDTLACMGGSSQVYLMVGDTVYSVDWEGNEIVVLADRASERNLVVNDSQTAIAWEISNETGQANTVQILYPDTGENQLMDAGEGNSISPEGFIGEDCILGFSHEEDEAVAGLVRVNPYYAVVIKERGGAEAARYEYDGIYVSAVTVVDGQVVLERLRKTGDGEFSSIESDTLIRNLPDTGDTQAVLESHSDELKKRVWYLVMDEADKERRFEVEFHVPDRVSYAVGEAMRLPTVGEEDTPMQYYAFAEGKLVGIMPDAGSAIAEVFDRMGTVTDSNGRLVWYRTTRRDTVNLMTSEQVTASGGRTLQDCLRQILGINGMDVSALENMEADISAMDAMETLFPDRVVNLSDCSVRALLYYVNRGCPVLVQDQNLQTKLLIGFDQYNVEYYDPVRGTIYKQGQQDAAKELEDGSHHFLSYLPGM